MSKPLAFLIALIFMGDFQLYAQDKTIVTQETTGLNKKQFKEILNREFGNLFNAQSKNNIGNFASLDLTEAEVSFSGNLIFNNGSILGVKATGGIIDGFLPIFSNSKLNTKFGLDIQYNFLGPFPLTLLYSEPIRRENERKKNDIQNQYQIKLLEIKKGAILKQSEVEKLELKKDELVAQLDSCKVKKDLIKLENEIILKECELENYPLERELLFDLKIWNAHEIKKLDQWKEDELKKPDVRAITDHRAMMELAYKRKRKDLENQYKIRKLTIDQKQGKILKELELKELKSEKAKLIGQLKAIRLRKGSIDIEIEKLETQIDFMNKELANYSSVQGDLELNLKNWKAQEINKIDNNIKTYGFKIGWFSVGFGLSSKRFNLFFPDSLFENQIKKETFASLQWRIQYSFYNFSPTVFESYYLSGGISFSLEDNLPNLKKVEISEVTDHGPNTNDRSVTEKFNAYIGDYKDNLKTLSVFGDFYRFLFEDNKGALHFYPEYTIKEELNSSINLGVGFLLVFKNKEQSANNINAELYLNLIDIANSNKSAENLLGRSDFGIRFTFPIEFSTIK